MIATRHVYTICAALLVSGGSARSAQALPPLITTTATTTLDAGGRPWAYVALGENRPGLIAGRHFEVFARLTSGAAFTSRGSVASTLDPQVISVMLGRAASLGDSLPALEAQLITLHSWLLTPAGQSALADAPAMPLAQRLAALQTRAAGDTRLASLLDAYGASHPAIKLVRGTGWAGRLDVPVGTEVVLELRELDINGREVGVTGRVTLHAGQPDRLPAPGPVVALPDTAGQGDLAVRLRWATPDALRKASTQHQGDVVWRLSKTLTEANGFDKNPPVAQSLDRLALSDPGNAQRLAGPVFPPTLYDAASVGDFVADKTNAFVVDDHNRHAVGGVPFDEGSQYYYFVAAADPVGRPGDVSSGLSATLCRRIPPPMPSRLKVTVQWDPGTGAYWDISWPANAPGDGTPTSRYELFRGDDFVQLTAAQRGVIDLGAPPPIVPGNPSAIQSVAVVADPGGPAGQLLHASLPGDGSYGKTWWFAIRAVHAGPPGCGDLVSALSPPALSALPNTSTPPSPDPPTLVKPVTDCLRVACVLDQAPLAELVTGTLDKSLAYYVVRCTRKTLMAAAHFRVTNADTGIMAVPETEVVFPPDEDTVELEWTLPVAQVGANLKVECLGQALGKYPSDWAVVASAGIVPDNSQRMAFSFITGAIAESERLALTKSDPLFPLFGGLAGGACAANWPSDTHLVLSPATGQILHPRFYLPLGPGARQYRFYRRIDNGPTTLVGQGLQDFAGPGSTVLVEDPAPPVSNGAVDYFSQFLDENGVASTMHRLAHLTFTGDAPPAPVLLTPGGSDFAGTFTAPTVTLSWIAPPEHIERFEVLFNTDKPAGDPDPHVRALVGRLSSNSSANPVIWKVRSRIDTLEKNLLNLPRSYLTSRVGGDIGAGPRFTLGMQVDPTLKYTVWVRALGPNGEPSDHSHSIEFQWMPSAAPPGNIAWPMRPLPPVASFSTNIQVVDFRDVPDSRLIWSYTHNGGLPIPLRSVAVDTTPVGIRVGSLAVDDRSIRDVSTTPPYGPLLFTPHDSKSAGLADPNLQVFTRDGNVAQRLFPAVLYRQQVANDRFPTVSGNVAQCSPLIRSVAWYASRVNVADVVGQLVDPLFRWVGPSQDAPRVDLFLVDTQPVVQGARYRYWLVRFSDLGEPIQTVPCGEVLVKSP